MILLSITRLLKSAVTENLELKLIAFLIAVLLVFLVTFQEESERFIDVEIVWQPPDANSALVMTSSPPDKVRVRLRGPTPTINSLKPGVIPPINVDLSSMTEGISVYHFSENNFRLPPRCQFLSVNPVSAQIRMERIVSRLLPVRVQTFGRLKYGTEMNGRPETNPNKLVAMGAASAMRGLEFVETEDVEIEGLGVGEHVFIVPSQRVDGITIRNGDEIKVSLSVGWIQGNLVLKSVPVQCSSELNEEITCKPNKVKISLSGSELALEKLKEDKIIPTISLTEEQLARPGTYSTAIKLNNLPGNLKVDEIVPRKVHATVLSPTIDPTKKKPGRRRRKK